VYLLAIVIFLSFSSSIHWHHHDPTSASTEYPYNTRVQPNQPGATAK